MSALDPATLHRPTLSGHTNRTIHLRGFLCGRGYFKAAEAMDYAASFHTGVRKDGTTPEFAHQVSIVSYLCTLLPHLRYPEETLAVGFLHDVIEDYEVTASDIESQFGNQVATSTVAMSKVYLGVKRSPESVAQAQAADPIASLVKGADRINNQQTMPGVFSQEKILAYLDETRALILPMLKLARRRFPDQELAYQNVRTLLLSQVELLEAALAGLVPPAQ